MNSEKIEEVTDIVPQSQDKTRLSVIWLVPILASFIGIGMLINNWHNQGAKVVISFETAEGLETGKTLVKYRNVAIGVVESINFNSDQSLINVGLKIDKNMRAFLNPDTLFWVVRPRVGADGISGFGTLVSGAYIEISPGSQEGQSTLFTGLESPPVTPPSTPGVQVNLTSLGGKPVKVGNPIIYRGFQVGRVEKFEFDPISHSAVYQVFIDAPYDSLVTSNTHFWNAGGAAINTSTTGVSIDIGSVETLLTGGLEFDIPEGYPLGERVDSGHVFELFTSKSDVIDGKQYRYIDYVVLVEDSIGGLNKGASVEFRGIRIGTVEDSKLAFHNLAHVINNNAGSRIPVLIRIEPERIIGTDSFAIADFEQQVDQWILGGLTASIETANLLTGGLKVSMDSTGKGRDELEKFTDYTVIPSAPGGFANLTEKLESILTTVNELPLSTTVERINNTLLAADKTIESLEDTLKVLESTLVSARPPADFYQSTQSAMFELEGTLNKIQILVQQITNKPNSLIFGDEKLPDVEPKSNNQ